MPAIEEVVNRLGPVAAELLARAGCLPADVEYSIRELLIVLDRVVKAIESSDTRGLGELVSTAISSLTELDSILRGRYNHGVPPQAFQALQLCKRSCAIDVVLKSLLTVLSSLCLHNDYQQQSSQKQSHL